MPHVPRTGATRGGLASSSNDKTINSVSQTVTLPPHPSPPRKRVNPFCLPLFPFVQIALAITPQCIKYYSYLHPWLAGAGGRLFFLMPSYPPKVATPDALRSDLLRIFAVHVAASLKRLHSNPSERIKAWSSQKACRRALVATTTALLSTLTPEVSTAIFNKTISALVLALNPHSIQLTRPIFPLVAVDIRRRFKNYTGYKLLELMALSSYASESLKPRKRPLSKKCASYYKRCVPDAMFLRHARRLAQINPLRAAIVVTFALKHMSLDSKTQPKTRNLHRRLMRQLGKGSADVYFGAFAPQISIRSPEVGSL